jgi:hypothetical protein
MNTEVYDALYKRIMVASQHIHIYQKNPIILEIVRFADQSHAVLPKFPMRYAIYLQGAQGSGPIFLGRVIGGEDLFLSTFVCCLCHQCSLLPPFISPGKSNGHLHWLQDWILHASSEADKADLPHKKKL